MSITRKQKLIHIHSNVITSSVPKAPSTGDLAKGEIAVNYNSTSPRLFIENNDGGIVSFVDKVYVDTKESLSNKVTTISSAATDTQYFSAKAVYDYVTANEKTASAALNQLNATKSDTGHTHSQYELSANKATTFSSAATDTQYFSAKAVYDYVVDNEETTAAAINTLDEGKLGKTEQATDSDKLDGKHASEFSLTGHTHSQYEATANKVTSFSSSCTDTQYPSAKLVYDYVTAAINDLNNRMPYKVSTISEAATITLNSTAYHTYESCTLSSQTAIALTGGTSNAGYTHYILFINNGSSDCVITPPTGCYSTAATFKAPASGALEISYIYNGSKVIFTGSAELVTV